MKRNPEDISLVDKPISSQPIYPLWYGNPPSCGGTFFMVGWLFYHGIDFSVRCDVRKIH